MKVLREGVLVLVVGLAAATACDSPVPAVSPGERVIRLDLDDPIGVFASSPEEGVLLSSIGDGGILSTGGVVVLDRQTRQLVEYAADGTVVGMWGGEGSGPGEFISPRGLSVLPGDTVVVYDPRNRRMTIYGPGRDGPVIESVDLELFSRPPTGLWLLPDGGMVSHESSLRDVETIQAGSEADLVGSRLVVQHIGSTGGRPDTLASGLVGSEMLRMGSMQLLAAFSHQTLVDVAGGRVAIAPAYKGTVRVYRGAALEWEAALPGGLTSLSGGEVAQLRDSLRALAAENGDPFMAEVLFRQEFQPEHRPAFEDVQLSSSGRVLLREFEPLMRQGRAWWVVEPEVGFIGRIELPGGTDILQVEGSQILLVRRDSLDVPRVELHELDWGERTAGGH